jgi:hypothetical protein
MITYAHGMKQALFERRPLGWSRNPSQFPFRARAALLAALGALVCVFTRSQLDNFSVALPLAYLVSGLLVLAGSNDRWRSAPWLVALNTTVAFFGALLPSIYFGIFKPAFADASAMPIGWALTFIGAAMTGLMTDEWLASAQTLRRLGFYGRRVRRSFFGLSPRRARSR